VTLARRLVLGTLILLCLTLLALVWAADRSFRRSLETDLTASLEREAGLVRAALPADSALWPATVRRLANGSGHRVVLAHPDGDVRADSDAPAAAGGSSLGDAEEIREALTRERGISIERSRLGPATLHVAIPGGPGVVRVSASLAGIEAAARQARAALTGAGLIALLAGAVLALLAGRTLSRPLAELATSARAIATGAPPRFPRSTIPDIDALVQAFRQMDWQLAERFEALRRERAESAALLDAMTEGVIAADGRGRIVSANAAARRLLGYDPAESLPDLPELFRVKAARVVVDAVLGGEVVREREAELDGSLVLLSARPLPSGGALLVLFDQTEVRRLEAVRRDFVANVSHELKTPLTSISGYAETILTDRPEPDITRRFLETILGNARRMQRLVDDLLDLSRIEAGRWQPEPEHVDVGATIQDVWSGLTERAAARTVELQVELEPGADVVVVDPDGLRQVLLNLVDNALRYSPPGGRITCRSRVEGGGIVVSVSDTGPGIGREHLPRIFERFYRADHSRSRDEGGTGLGLAIVKHLVEAHDGRVWAESERGRGTTVSCWFPAPGAVSS
jgi:two-component system, OmpR family, phosphate regulon sensor histidine kinase PhoR